MTAINVPTHFSPQQARLVSQLMEVLIDALIDFHTAFICHYHEALDEGPGESLLGDCPRR